MMVYTYCALLSLAKEEGEAGMLCSEYDYAVVTLIDENNNL